MTRHRGVHFTRSEERELHHLFRRRKILLHQHRRKRKHVADVVEAVAGIVLRKVLRRVRSRLPSRSRMVLLYSERFNRRAVHGPAGLAWRHRPDRIRA